MVFTFNQITKSGGYKLSIEHEKASAFVPASPSTAITTTTTTTTERQQ